MIIKKTLLDRLINCNDLKTLLIEFKVLNDEMQSILNQIKNIESGGTKK